MRRNNLVQCSRCVMDSSALDISFDSKGYCNYCSKFLRGLKEKNLFDKTEIKNKLNKFLKKVKKNGRNKKYDCIIGVSGGVDSCWVLVQAIELGLRPLAVHMDNGWNSELAQNNIANIITKLKVDLFTHVIDWEEYKECMQAFFDADVIDIELLYDNAMQAVNYKLAKKFGVKYILSGSNFSTEGISIPRSWAWNKYDKRNIISITKRFSKVRLKSFPAIGTIDRIVFEFLFGIKWIRFLDLLEYNKQISINYLIDNFGFKPYPYKHYESVFTRFYQGYLLPEKFNVDKRKVHLSSLIMSSQISREEAINDLKKKPYISEIQLDEDKEYFLKKMNWSEWRLDEYISRQRIEHDKYASERKLYEILLKIKNKYFWNF